MVEQNHAVNWQTNKDEDKMGTSKEVIFDTQRYNTVQQQGQDKNSIQVFMLLFCSKLT